MVRHMKIASANKIGRFFVPLAFGLLLVEGQSAVIAGPQTPAAQETTVRRIVMRDARSATKFVDQLKAIQATGAFGGAATVVAGKPAFGDLGFLPSGNYVLVTGDKDRLDKYMGDINLMAFLYERPRAHLELNTRVVQLTGPANTDVIQMTETVRALVDEQRTEVVRAFSDLQDYLVSRLKRRSAGDLKIYTEIRRMLPGIGDGDRPLTVQEMLLLLMVDRALPDLPQGEERSAGSDADRALLAFQKSLTTSLRDPHESDEQIAHDVGAKLTAWETAVSAARDWCADSARTLDNRNGQSIDDFLASLKDARCPLPTWVGLRIRRSVELSQRLYPAVCRRQARDSLSELQRRFQSALDREHGIQENIAAIEAADNRDKTAQAKSGQDRPERVLPGALRRRLLDLQSVANDLVSVPMALFQAVAAAADDSAPDLNQLTEMFHEYADERAKLDQQLRVGEVKGQAPANYAKLEMIEAALNLWLRRGSEAMSRALEQQFYNHYVDQLRLLANRQLGRLSGHDILSSSAIENIPDVVQDVLLSDTSVNMFVSNSVSLQFEPDTVGSVSAQVSARMPSQTQLNERLAQAAQASTALNTIAGISQSTSTTATTTPSALTQLSQHYGLEGTDIINAILAGGQAVPVQSGISLTANPSVGFDAGTVTLTLTVNETLQPGSESVTDHVTNHSINDATVTALAYEPTVLSTLTSNLSYYQNTGGFPVLRQIPGLKDILKDVPAAPFREGKRSKGVYQSSLIILEPVVIPTVEDLVRFYSGLRS
jgi:hypothetical protein